MVPAVRIERTTFRLQGKPVREHTIQILRDNFAIARSYIAGADPLRGIENPKPYRPAPVNAANDAEIVSLFKAMDTSKMWPGTRLAIEPERLTGARPTEVRLATWSEFDLARRTWAIPSDRVKSDRAFRVHLSPQAVDVLERARVQRDGMGASSTDADLVFKGAKGKAMEKRAVGRALARLAERAAKEDGKRADDRQRCEPKASSPW